MEPLSSLKGSPEYGKYMTKKEVLDLIAPPARDARTVVQWIQGVCTKVSATPCLCW